MINTSVTAHISHW